MSLLSASHFHQVEFWSTLYLASGNLQQTLEQNGHHTGKGAFSFPASAAG